MRRGPVLLISLALGGMAGGAHAAPKPGDRMRVPEGFAMAPPRGSDQQVVYAHIVGERRHGVDRTLIEQTCTNARRMDPSVPQPVFEAGWDRPAKVDVQRFENARRRAEFSTTAGYACSNAAQLPRTPFAQPCGCIYRETVTRHTRLREQDATRSESIEVDHRARTVRRGSGPPMPALGPEQGAELAARLAPTVTGSETIAGLRCELRRQDLPGGARQEWCITPDDAKAVPDARLRGRALRHAQYPAGSDTPIVADRTVELVGDVVVDDAFFVVPPDYAAAPAGPKERR